MRDTARPATPRLLVTRPQAQAVRLADGAQRLGFDPIVLPCLTIEPLPCPTGTPRSGVAIFTSSNAVQQACARDGWPWPGVQALAIGAATATALNASGCPPACAPRRPYDSEALLQQLDDLPRAAHALRNALQEGITVVTGEGGRTLLVDTLRARGFTVQRREVYQRRVAAVTQARLSIALAPPPDIVSCSSDAVLDALVQIVSGSEFGAQRLERLQRLPLLVNGDRGAAYARTAGFNGPLLVARPAGDTGQLLALAQWLRDSPHR